MAGVLIVGEIAQGRLSPATLQIGSAGAQLAEALAEPLIGALIGADLTTAADEFQCGLKSLYLVDGAHCQPYTSEAYMRAAQAVIAVSAPSVILFVHSADTREWVPRLAARLNAGLVMDCAGVAVERDTLVVTKPVNGGGVLGEFIIHGRPRMATLRTGAFQPCSVQSHAERIRLDVPPPEQQRVEVLAEESLSVGAGPRLKDAKIIVAGGRGIGGPDKWHFIEEVSAVLGAAVGCSRPVADSGWVPSSHQVGLSGTSVAPDLYIAVGISGAPQHLAGITSARIVVAINNSADADIFSRADYGVVDDYREVLPAFVERIKQLRKGARAEAVP